MEITKIHKYLSGETTQKERELFEQWLDKSPENRRLFESYQKIYDVEIKFKNEYDTKTALKKFRHVMNKDTVTETSPIIPFDLKNTSRRSFRIWWKIAAILLISAILSLYMFTSDDFDERNQLVVEVTGTTITTEVGEQKTFKISDGSRVKLNADSEIYIPDAFGKLHREVQLIGEAFFEVTPLEDISFKVKTNSSVIEVLGTSFGVRAWREREESVVAVERGRVSVKSSNEIVDGTSILNAGEFSKIELDQAPTPAMQGDINQFIGWTEQKLVFDETPLKDVLWQLELHFNVHIEIDDSSRIEDPVTARYQNESLDEILEYTTITHDVNFTVNTPSNP